MLLKEIKAQIKYCKKINILKKKNLPLAQRISENLVNIDNSLLKLATGLVESLSKFHTHFSLKIYDVNKIQCAVLECNRLLKCFDTLTMQDYVNCVKLKLLSSTQCLEFLCSNLFVSKESANSIKDGLSWCDWKYLSGIFHNVKWVSYNTVAY